MSAAEVWERYAQRAPARRQANAAGAETWLNWTQYDDHGPNETVLGDLSGRTVLELGSGTGANLAHVARSAARCIGVDLAPSRVAAARQTWGGRSSLEFVTADAVDYLTAVPVRFDIIYLIFGAVWFTDPAVLLPLVRNKLTPDGVFVFSHLPATEEPTPPRSGRVVRKWHYSVEQWTALLLAAGFGGVTAEVIPAPRADLTGTLLVRASGTVPSTDLPARSG